MYTKPCVRRTEIIHSNALQMQFASVMLSHLLALLVLLCLTLRILRGETHTGEWWGKATTWIM